MSWANPYALGLLLVIPAIAGWWQRRRLDAGLPFSSVALLKGLATPRVRWAERLAGWGRLTVLVLVILALARPRWPDPGTAIPAHGRAVMLVLDVSGSMAERDLVVKDQAVSRLQAAKTLLLDVLDPQPPDARWALERADDLIGVVTFATQPEDVCPPTHSRAAVRAILEQAEPCGKSPDNATNLGDALALAVDLVERSPPSRKTIILVSDGEHNVPEADAPGALKPRQAAQLARALGVVVHTIYLAGPGADERAAEAWTALHDVARLTGGTAHRVEAAGVLEAIGRAIDQMERTRIASFDYEAYVELYPWLAGLAVLFIVGLAAIESTWFRRVP